MRFDEALQMLNEEMVPMSMSYSKWKKLNISPKEYEQKHPGTKWKIVHCHHEPIGKPINKSAVNLSYEKALKMHRAIQWSKH